MLRGAGDDFCAGADWVATNSDDGARPRTGSIQRRTPLQAHRLIELIIEVQLPVVCAVRGWAAGLGCQLALAADFTVADGVRPVLGAVRRSGVQPRQRRHVAPAPAGRRRPGEGAAAARAQELTGREAADWGSIHRAVPDAELDGRGRRRSSTRLANGPTVAIGLTKRCIHRALDGLARRGDGGGSQRARAELADRGLQGGARRIPRDSARPASKGRWRWRDGEAAPMSYETIHVRGRRPHRDDHLRPARPAERVEPGDDPGAARTPTPRAEADHDVWITIVTGNGRAFCAGADVTEIPDDGRVVYEEPYLSTYEQWEAPQEGTPPFRTMTKPILAAVNGLCCGAGLDLVTTGDIVIASDRAEFFDPHVSIGLVSGREMVRLARVLPTNIAMRMALMGQHERMSAQRGVRARARLRGRRARPPARAGARDRGHRQPQRAARGARARASPSARVSTSRCTRPRSWPRRSASASCAPTTPRKGPQAFVEKRDPEWRCR